MIRWILAEGRENDREVDEPKTTDEIVILRVEQVEGKAFSPHFPGLNDTFEWDDKDDVVILFARAGNDDLLGWELTETAARALFQRDKDLKQGDWHGFLWPELPRWKQRNYVTQAQIVLAAVTAHMREKRGESTDT
jgi:hypothetical protein